jgi:NitT/TauT family transport system substrate-binding protein
MPLNRRQLLTVIMGVCLLGISTACDRASQNPQTVKIGYSKLRITLPVFVAETQGLFKKHGIQATLIPYDTAQPLMQALIAGSIDLGGYTALPITYSAMLRGNAPLYFITEMDEDQDHRISYLLRPPGSKIGAIADLKGKRIGILATTAYDGWLREILEANNVKPSDVTITGLAPEQQVPTLKNGGVDALFTNDPMATAAIREKAGELISQIVECPKYIRDPFPFGSFNASKKWADANPGTFQSVVAALDEAVAYINSHPKEAQDSMRNYIAPEFKQDVESYPYAKYLATDQVSPDVFQEMVDLYVKQKIIPGKLDVKALIISNKKQ